MLGEKFQSFDDQLSMMLENSQNATDPSVQEIFLEYSFSESRVTLKIIRGKQVCNSQPASYSNYNKESGTSEICDRKPVLFFASDCLRFEFQHSIVGTGVPK